MFEIGFWELALLAALGLIVLGPEKLPKVAAQLGRYAGQARRMARTLTAQVREEIEAEERRLNAAAAADARPASPPAAAPAATEYHRPGAADLIPGNAPADTVANTVHDTAGQAATADAAATTTARDATTDRTPT